MIKTFCLTALTLLMFQSLNAQKPMSVQEYINTYRGLAIEEMKKAGIPASITMAQALLESNNGGSRLAVEANNHFGIKCQVEWTGPSITHDDDAKGECFRKYDSPEASYKDHSAFLTTRSRYAFLFDYPVTDYKSWANGLKTAGYATNPQYANSLIRIIEENSLHLLDSEALGNAPASGTASVAGSGTVAAPATTPGMVIDLADPNAGYVVEKINGIRAVRAKDGDTFATVAAALRKKSHVLAGFNELPFDATLKEGQVVYLFPKHKKAKGTATHVVQQGESMHSISQQYGVRVLSLYKLNFMADDYQVKVGERIHLR